MTMKVNFVSFIYKATCITNGKSYIGQTINPIDRIKKHIRGRGGCPVIASAINKHGSVNIQWEIIEAFIPLDKINERETFWIRELNTRTPNGYNLTEGGEGCPGRILTDEHKKKIGDANRGRIRSEETKLKIGNAHRGKVVSEETRRLCGLTKKGIPLTDEHKKKIIESNKKTREFNKLNGISVPRKPRKPIPYVKSTKPRKTRKTGYKHSEETKEKIRRANLGKVLSTETKLKVGLARSGKPLSKEHIEQIKIAKRIKNEEKRNLQQDNGSNREE